MVILWLLVVVLLLFVVFLLYYCNCLLLYYLLLWTIKKVFLTLTSYGASGPGAPGSVIHPWHSQAKYLSPCGPAPDLPPCCRWIQSSPCMWLLWRSKPTGTWAGWSSPAAPQTQNNCLSYRNYRQTIRERDRQIQIHKQQGQQLEGGEQPKNNQFLWLVWAKQVQLWSLDSVEFIVLCIHCEKWKNYLATCVRRRVLTSHCWVAERQPGISPGDLNCLKHTVTVCDCSIVLWVCVHVIKSNLVPLNITL